MPFAASRRTLTKSGSTASPSSEPAAPELALAFDAQALERVFAPGGLLDKALPGQKRVFEERPEQLQMAQAVASAIEDKAHLLVEAGTGTGKSYAYLVPFILWAVANDKKVLIATHTKALQQQLVERDLPFLCDLFLQKAGLEFRFALCLGSQNYICPRRLQKAEVGGLFATREEVDQLQRIRTFAQRSKTGRNLDLKFEPPSQLWAQVNRESDLCLGRNCEFYDRSFYYLARREQERAHVLVANHHLLFAHLAAGGNAAVGGGGGVLPVFDALVIDEAHHIEDVASAHLGIEMVNLGVARLIELLHHRRSNRTVFSGGTLPNDKRDTLEKRLIEAAEEAREATGRFFENLQTATNLDATKSTTLRLRRPNFMENTLAEPLTRLEDILRDALKITTSLSDDGLSKDLEGFAARCATTKQSAAELISMSKPDYVYWAAAQPRSGDGGMRRVPRLSLHGAPIEVAQPLQESVFGKIVPAILTSATLATGGNFEFLKQRLGLDEERSKQPVRTLTLGSPFDFRRNALLYVARDLPDPANGNYFDNAAIKRAAEVVKRTHGRAFVLCTSFRMVDATARFLTQIMPKGIKILRQGETARGQLLNEFREDVSSVLVGTTSFWQGVDVPGESLTCVVIMKLPFAVPDDPLVQARVEKMRAEGHDPFKEYQVPQAVMMFRQGFGRLIRTRTDRGIVAILDPRVVTKNYGATFLHSLPECRLTEDLDEIETFAAADSVPEPE